jgi:hypothetical protein
MRKNKQERIINVKHIEIRKRRESERDRMKKERDTGYYATEAGKYCRLVASSGQRLL